MPAGAPAGRGRRWALGRNRSLSSSLLHQQKAKNSSWWWQQKARREEETTPRGRPHRRRQIRAITTMRNFARVGGSKCQKFWRMDWKLLGGVFSNLTKKQGLRRDLGYSRCSRRLRAIVVVPSTNNPRSIHTVTPQNLPLLKIGLKSFNSVFLCS